MDEIRCVNKQDNDKGTRDFPGARNTYNQDRKAPLPEIEKKDNQILIRLSYCILKPKSCSRSQLGVCISMAFFALS